MRPRSILTLLICICVNVGAAPDGFNLWFTTNKEEKDDYPIHFDNPLPVWLRGTYIRNGPGQFEVGKRHFVNGVDGFAKLSSWRFHGNGSVYFSTKLLQSEFYKNSIQKNNIDAYFSLEGVEPHYNVEEILSASVHGIDNTNVNVYNFSNTNDDKLATLTDAWNLNLIDSKLNQIGRLNPKHPTLNNTKPLLAAIKIMSCAHPLPEINKDTHITFYFSLSLIPEIKHRQTVVRVRSPDDRQAIAEWELDKVSLTHSFSLTENYAIFFNAPYYASVVRLQETATVLNGMKWEKGAKTDVYIVHKASGNVKKIQIDNVMVFHHINAYELPDGRIVTDVAAHYDPYFSLAYTMSLVLNSTSRRSLKYWSTLNRYVFDTVKMTSSMMSFQDSPEVPYASKFEVPTINELYRSRHYCFVYGVVCNFDQKGFSHVAIVKKDVCNQGRDRKLYIPENYPSEAWFVPSPSMENEDDGVLMSVYLDGINKRSYLAIIDAKTLNITHTAILPTYVPFNFHGRFFPDIY